MIKLIVAGLFSLYLGFLWSNDAQASTSGVVIYQVQTGAPGKATSEFVSLYNNANTDIDITNWCLTSNTAEVACMAPPNNNVKLWLQPHTYLTFASEDFIVAHPSFQPNGTSFVAGGNSGKFVASSGVLTLKSNQVVIDAVVWGSGGLGAPDNTKGQILQRNKDESGNLVDTNNDTVDFTITSPLTTPPTTNSDVVEETILIDVCPNIPGVDTMVPIGFIQDGDGNCYEDVCDNMTGLQKSVPSPYYRSGIDCLPHTLAITELLPNVAGVDTGSEFIEFYNPTQVSLNLADYYLQVGPSFSKNYSLPNVTVEPGAYASITDTQSAITLANTTASLRLYTSMGDLVTEVPSYQDPQDNESWADIGGVWQYTDSLTPGSVNIPRSVKEVLNTDSSDSTACSAGKFRNPETNRCKTIEADDELKPCAVDQVRSPETNRCRSVLSTANSSLTPCKEGQERNPETNRCRSLASATSAQLKPCAPGQERNPETNRCRKKADAVSLKDIKEEGSSQQGGTPQGWWLAGIAATGFGGYALWEWRTEALAGVRRIKGVFAKNPPTD